METFERVQVYGFEFWQLPVRLVGITPLLMHNPAGSMGKPAEDRKRIPTPEEEATAATYRLPTGELYVQAIAVRNCLLEGCSRGDFRYKRKSLKSILAAALIIEPELLLLHRNGESITEWGVDVRRAVIQRAAIMRGRALIATPWELVLTALVDTTTYPTVASLQPIGNLFGFSGRFVGILDFRPARLGWFGQFTAEIPGL